MIRRFILVVLVLVAGWIVGACSTKNPVAPSDPGTCDHADADGLVIEQGTSLVAAQWQAAATGAIALADTQSAGPFVVTFLSPDSTRMSPSTSCFELRGEIADTNVARFEPDPSVAWSFRVRGKAAGTTTLRVRIWHGDHADFTSQPFTVTVSGAPPHDPAGATRAVLWKGGNRVSSWNWRVPTAYGRLYVPQGGTTWPIGVQWLDSLETALAPGAGYSLGWSVTNPAIATFASVPGQPWHVQMTGHAAGSTQVTFSLLWNGVPEWTTGALDVVVDDTTSAPAQPANFVLRKSGVRHVFVENGAIVPSCGTTASTGFLPALADTIEDLFNFRITTPPGSCSGVVPGSSSIYSLVYEFGEPAMAGVVAHPEHAGEYFDFHFRGLALGSTTVRVVLLSGNQVAFRSPWMPLAVTSTPSLVAQMAGARGRDDARD